MYWDDQSWFFIPRDSDHPLLWIIGNLVSMYVIVCFLLWVTAAVLAATMVK